MHCYAQTKYAYSNLSLFRKMPITEKFLGAPIRLINFKGYEKITDDLL